MTYPAYAQKARLPQRRPRFLFHRPARSIIRVVPPPPAPLLFMDRGLHATEASKHQGNTKAPRHRNSKTLRHQGHTPSLPPGTTGQRPPVTTDRQLPFRLQPANSSHPSHNRQSTKQAPLPAPPQKKREAARIEAASRSFSCRRAPYFCTAPDAASRRLLRCLR